MHSLSIQKRLRKHKGAVNSISFNSTGSLLLSASDDETAVLWNLEDPASALNFYTGHGNNVLDAHFMPLSDDRSIVTCGADGEVYAAGVLPLSSLSFLHCSYMLMVWLFVVLFTLLICSWFGSLLRLRYR